MEINTSGHWSKPEVEMEEANAVLEASAPLTGNWVLNPLAQQRNRDYTLQRRLLTPNDWGRAVRNAVLREQLGIG